MIPGSTGNTRECEEEMMEIKPGDEKKHIVIFQYAALLAAILLFVPLSLLSLYLANSIQWGFLMILPLHLFIGISSVRNQVSILKPRGRGGCSRGNQAVIYGNIMIAGTLITAVILLVLPSIFPAF
jgi:hypothetical protein